jgi:hypothetical protein
MYVKSCRIEVDMREIAKLIQSSEESFRQAQKAFDSVSDIPVEWTLQGDVGMKEYEGLWTWLYLATGLFFKRVVSSDIRAQYKGTERGHSFLENTGTLR